MILLIYMLIYITLIFLFPIEFLYSMYICTKKDYSIEYNDIFKDFCYLSVGLNFSIYSLKTIFFILICLW